MRNYLRAAIPITLMVVGSAGVGQQESTSSSGVIER